MVYKHQQLKQELTDKILQHFQHLQFLSMFQMVGVYMVGQIVQVIRIEILQQMHQFQVIIQPLEQFIFMLYLLEPLG